MKLQVKIFCLSALLLAAGAVVGAAQSVITTVNKNFVVNKYSLSGSHSFKVGDTIEIFGYKKKSGEHHIAVQCGDYVEQLKMQDWFFAAEPKTLKKLADALGNEVKQEVADRKAAIVNGKMQRQKALALSGKLRRKIKDGVYKLRSDKYGIVPEDGDSVYVLGYKQDAMYRYFAVYNDELAGIFQTMKSVPFTLDLIYDYMPSTDDPDVQAELSRQRQRIAEAKAARRKQRREDALNCKVKAVVNTRYLVSRDDSNISKPAFGDTVSVLGYTHKDHLFYYALYGYNAAGIYTDTNWSGPFKEKLDTLGLPPVDAPEVSAQLDRCKKAITARKALQDSLENIEYEQNAQRIIDRYKEMDPCIVTVEDWDMNSAGGITVNISVRNTSLQTIKYITFNGYFTNAVGDRVCNDIGGGTTWSGRGIGPIGPRPTSLDDFDERFADCRGSYTFDNLTFYSRVAHYFHLSSVVVQYMNGKTITLSGDRLAKHVIYE